MAEIAIDLPIEDEALAMRLEKFAPADRIAALVAARLEQVCHTAATVRAPTEAPARLLPAACGCVTPTAAVAG